MRDAQTGRGWDQGRANPPAWLAEEVAEADRELARSPKSPRPHALRALALAALRREHDAIAAADAAVARAPRAAWVHAVRSTVLREVGRSKEALTAAEEAVRLAPDDARSEDVRSLALVALGRVHEAMEMARRAAQLAPGDAAVIRRLGDRRLDADPDEAERYYRASLRLDRRSAAALAGLGRALERQGKRAESEEAYEAASELDPTVLHSRQHARRTVLTLLQTAGVTFLLVVMMGWVPAIVAARWPAAARVGFFVWIAAAAGPIALLVWAAGRVRRAHRELPPSPELTEMLREVAARAQDGR